MRESPKMEKTQNTDINIEEEEFDFSEKYELVKETATTRIYAYTTYIEVEAIDYDQFITENDDPVDNIFSEKQQRLLIDPLHANQWTDRDFLASANVAIYYQEDKPPVVPDMFLSFDVKAPEEWFEKKNRCYFLWRFGKAPEIVVEVISNKVGKEEKEKKAIYAQMGVLYYILIDPYLNIYPVRLKLFKLNGKEYQEFEEDQNFMPEINLGIRLWEGLFEKHKAPWGRWCSKEGEVLKTGAENTTELTEIVEQQNETLQQQKVDLEKEKERTEKLAKLLEELGVNPDKV